MDSSQQDRLAQSVEHQTSNLRAVGSSPTVSKNFSFCILSLSTRLAGCLVPYKSVADPELNLGGGFSRLEGPSGEGTGGVSPPVGGGSGGLPRENFEKMMQNGAILGANKVF